MIKLFYSLTLVPVVFINTGTSRTSCGIDNSLLDYVYEGKANIETYPWLGILSYPVSKKKLVTTAVVLVTRQIVLGAASEIDALPKVDFRKRSKVTLGHNCSGPSIGVRDYTYHPDYSKNTYSALAMIQLEVDNVKIELRPICAPPTYFKNPDFYAMIQSDDCQKSTVMIHKMKYVPLEQCRSFYRRSGLDVDTMWPSHTACARSTVRGRCLWRSGAVLVGKQGRQWRLLGFGVYGPGCEAPARFLDYGMYHKWVKVSISRIGKPAITKLDSNMLVLRRSMQNVQRFGPCDPEEIEYEIYSDRTTVIRKPLVNEGTASFNVSLYANVEYSCVIFKATYEDSNTWKKPSLRLKRWCTGPRDACYGFQFIEIQLSAVLKFTSDVTYSMYAYGKQPSVIDVNLAIRYFNTYTDAPLIYKNYTDLLAWLKEYKKSRTSRWFYHEDGI